MLTLLLTYSMSHNMLKQPEIPEPQIWANVNHAAVETAIPKTEQCPYGQLDSITISLNTDEKYLLVTIQLY